MSDHNDDDGGSNDAEGFFARRRSARNQALAGRGRSTSLAQQTFEQGIGKLASVLASGADVQTDSQKVVLLLASYGDGEKMGRYAFNGEELLEQTDIPAARLRDAVALLVGKGWAETTEDGAFLPGSPAKALGWYEAKLTTLGRSLAQQAVRGRGAAPPSRFEGGSMPSVFDGAMAPPVGASAALSDLEQLQTMLARAKIPHRVEVTTADEGGEGAAIDMGDNTTFSFDVSGKLRGFSD